MEPAEIIQDTLASIYTLFQSSTAHPERLLYAAVGLIFVPTAPPPHGGPRLKPGYTNYCGQTPKDLLEYIVTGSYEMYCKDRKVLDFVATCINKVMALQYRGMKDAMDERLLQGLRKAGHIEWHGAAVIPEYMAHSKDIPAGPNVVEFTPQRKQILEGQNETWGETPGTLFQRKRNRQRTLAQQQEESVSSPSGSSNNGGSGSGSGSSGSSSSVNSGSREGSRRVPTHRKLHR
ncbi:hypothetical protein BDR26DRAFT_1012733 [Obelidium mucronatum]|nr:hypothetical protein BDR26DRAFT_1012733 [Obelidium mucronatum]